MGFYEKMRAAERANDVAAFDKLVDEDFVFVRHKDGSQLNRAQSMDMIKGMMETGKWVTEEDRCVYENDDICVSHAKMSFPDGSRESVMSIYHLKDGKAVRLETGATPL